MPAAQWGDESGYLGAMEIYADERPAAAGPAGWHSGKVSRTSATMFPMISPPLHGSRFEQLGLRASAAFRSALRKSGAILTVYAHEPGISR